MNKQQIIKRLEDNISQFDIILEFGDICYADGDQEIWDKFFNHIQTIAACKPWMVTVGNHEKEVCFIKMLFCCFFRSSIYLGNIWISEL